ncbi:MAG: inositol monophosphatase [bacterium]|nr:inositol monophosphatase [bacterium]
MKAIDNDKILSVTLEAARTAGDYLKKMNGRAGQPEVEFKGAVDLVTECDRESQAMICGTLEKHFPNHSILAEEDLHMVKDNALTWVIDPLDGTVNFAHSLPIFSVSIAFMVEGETRVGVVYAPMLGEMFHAVEGGGAFLNGKPLGVSNRENLGQSLLATGFPYDRREAVDHYIGLFKDFITKARDIRRMGSAAIDLAYTAAGRLDGFWEFKLKPWDTAAAWLMVKEAGGKVTDFSGNPFNPFMEECLATNGHIHEQMLERTRKKV